eukprot:1159605-Pelagomonas_calceolata.AAC.7
MELAWQLYGARTDLVYTSNGQAGQAWQHAWDYADLSCRTAGPATSVTAGCRVVPRCKQQRANEYLHLLCLQEAKQGKGAASSVYAFIATESVRASSWVEVWLEMPALSNQDFLPAGGCVKALWEGWCTTACL